MSEASIVTFTIQRRATGRRVRGRCKRRTHANRRKRHCTRWVRVGRFSQAGVSGRNTTPFKGRIGGKKLKRARYRVSAVARDAAGNRSTTRTARFRIVRR